VTDTNPDRKHAIDSKVLAAWIIGGVLMIFGLVSILAMIVQRNADRTTMGICGGLAALGAILGTSQQIRKFVLGGGGVIFEAEPSTTNVTGDKAPSVSPRKLPKEVKERRAARVELLRKPIPGLNAEPFTLADAGTVERAVPGSDPFTPMYRLDKDYRIIDWNIAFTLAFERTMEGRRGQSVLEWVYFLDNFDQSLTHGMAAFGDPKNLPQIDVEKLVYTSQRYGIIEAEKRAYQIPKSETEIDSWLCILDLKFHDESQTIAYYLDLMAMLGEDLLWSEYAVSYDRVLNNTEVYPSLLGEMLGQVLPAEGSTRIVLQPIRCNSRVLDLGDGTGNITRALAEPEEQRTIVAIDNNRMMLKALRYKCRDFLRVDDKGPGVFVTRQDITSLFGLEDESFDYAIMNNVLYALENPDDCLREILRVLKPGGEIRVSGPRRDTNLKTLFSQIKRELVAKNQFERVSRDYTRVERINNTRLNGILFKWTIDDVEEKLTKLGFSKIIYRNPHAYGGEGMIIAAVK